MAEIKTFEDTFPSGTPESDLEAECRDRLREGAVTCKYEKRGDEWIMRTEYKVAGT